MAVLEGGGKTTLSAWVPSVEKGQLLAQEFHYRTVGSPFSRQSPPQILLLVHGFGEHQGRYRPLLKFLLEGKSPPVHAVATYDHLGHGRSEGQRGHANSVEVFVRDLRSIWEQLEKQSFDVFGSIPPRIHLLGHSFGGWVVFRWVTQIALNTLQASLGSVLLSAPFFGLKIPVPWIQRKFAEWIAPVWGNLPFRSTLDPRLLSHDLSVVQAYQKDPLVHRSVTPAWFLSMEKALQEIIDTPFFEVPVPIQILLPQEDGIVHPEATRGVFEKIQAPLKRLQQYPGLFHEIFNESARERPLQDLKQWLLSAQKEGPS